MSWKNISIKMQIFCQPIENLCTFGNDFSTEKRGRKGIKGEMSEWFKEHAWKVCVLQKGTAGSNPALSATNCD